MARAKTPNVIAFHNAILERASALGNSKRGLKEVASDLINDYGRHRKRELCDGCFLSPATLERVADCDPDYRPQADTLERIIRFFGGEITFNSVVIKPRFRNQPKV